MGSIPQESANLQPASIFAAIQGHWLTACLAVLLELRIPDILVAGGRSHPPPAGSPTDSANGSTKECQGCDTKADGHDRGSYMCMDIDEIAMASDAVPGHLYKVLRVCAQHGLLDEMPGKRFSPNDATRQLLQDCEPPTLGHLASHLVNKPKWDAWKMLPEAVKQGKTSFVLAHGMDVYQYGELPQNSTFGEEFCKSMSFFTKHSLTGGSTSLQDAYDWSKCSVVMDVGGGRGELLSTVMSWMDEKSKGLLLDRQMVIDRIDVPGMFESKRVRNAAERLTLLVGDVREPFPAPAHEAKVDTLIMKHFLSAFSDEDAVLIVGHCKQVLAPSGSILLLQTLVPEAGDRDHNVCEDGVAPGLFSIEILAQCPGGAWRTLSEWEDLFGQAGMALQSNTAVGCNMNLMVWKPKPVLG